MVFDQNPLTSETADYISRTGLISRTGNKSAMLEGDITNAEQITIKVSNYGDGFAYDRANLINPVLVDADGNETSLLTLTPASYTSEFGTLHTNRNVEGGTLKVEGKSYSKGLGMNAECTLVYSLPKGHNYVKFSALCGYDSSCDTDNKSATGTTMEFILSATESESYTFDLTLLGYGPEEEVPLHDIWAKKDEGTAQGKLILEIPTHGVKLYRLGNDVADGIDRIQNTDEAVRRPVSGNGVMYNLSGLPVSSPAPRSIYIKDGKKYISPE